MGGDGIHPTYLQRLSTKISCMNIRVVLVDDHPIFLEGIREAIDGQGGIRVVGVAHNGATALRKVKALRPDVVLLDIGLPDISGFEVFERLHPALPGTKFMILTVHSNEEFREAFRLSGASGYLVKNTPPAILVKAIREVYANGTWFPEIVPDKPIALPARSPLPGKGTKVDRGGSHEFGLTKTERRIAGLLVRGLSTGQVGVKLNLSHHTVKTHVKHIYTKLKVRSRGEAIAKLLHIPPPREMRRRFNIKNT